MLIKFSKEFRKKYQKTPHTVKHKLETRLAVFKVDPFDPVLNNHLLKGMFLGHRSINVTGDWRAIYRVEDEKTIFVTIGTHSQLYG